MQSSALSLFPRARIESPKNILPTVAVLLIEEVAKPLSNPLNYSQQTKRHANKMKENPHFEEGTQCSNM